MRVGDASMELPLPLVPVHTRTERRLFNQMMLRATEAVLGLKQLALTWFSSVDERDVYPKHETHLRLYFAQWGRNSCARKATEQAATGVAALRKFNAASPSSATGCSSAASVAHKLPPPPPRVPARPRMRLRSLAACASDPMR